MAYTVIVRDMRMQLGDLRRLIHEEVDRFVRNSAGFVGGGVGGGRHAVSTEEPELGDEGCEDINCQGCEKCCGEDDNERSSPKTQLTARVIDKQGGPWNDEFHR